MLRRITAGAALALALLLGPALAPAGDDVDYSAPYLVVENGELVTRYPALEHEGAAPASATATAGTRESPPPENRQTGLWMFAAAGGGAVLAMLLWMQRRRTGK